MYATKPLSDYNQQSTINTKNFILSGPNPHEYWWHSPGAKQPLEREEGPFPPQGNIGMLVGQETSGYRACNPHNKIGGSPNCTGTFSADYYTPTDLCGDQCTLKEPEIYGDKNFGLVDGNLVTSIHSLDAYQNVRAASPGQRTNGAYGCYEWIPREVQKGDYCLPGYSKPYAQVGNWLELSENQSIVNPGWNPESPEPSAPISAPISAPVSANPQ